jgi:hypothetical protein
MVPKAGERLRATLEIGNSGRSAAKHLQSNVSLEAVPRREGERMPPTKFTGDFGVPPNVGGVGVEISLALTKDGKNAGPLTETDVRGIFDGQLVVYLHGRFRFQDVFGERHWLDVCRVWKPDEVNGLTGGNGGWRDCSKNQRTDDDAR